MAGNGSGPPSGLRVSFHAKAPPVAILAVAQLAQIPVEAQADPKLTPDSQPVISLPDR